MQLCVDHYQSAVWVSGWALTFCSRVVAFVGARTGEHVPRRRHYCSCLPLIPPPPFPSPWPQTPKRTYCSCIWRQPVEAEVMMSDLMTKTRSGGHHKARCHTPCHSAPHRRAIKTE